MENVGGQAVIEGVMIRSPKYIVTAVRKSSGKIVYQKTKTKSLTSKRFFKWPLVRGMVILIESMITGIKSLNYSAKEANDGGEEEEDIELSPITIILTLIFSIGFALLLFKFIPLAIVQILNLNFKAFENKYLFNIIEGLLKFLIFLSYIYLISRFKDIRRVFQYHGAEHKVVNSYENEKKLDLKSAKKYSTIHKRCGTSFILFVLLISIFVYVFIPLDYSFLIKFLIRIALLPIIAGFSYEILKLSSKHENNKMFNILISPGLFLQKITTEEPNEKQLEVALFALKKSLE